jgi:hypothetical protein
MKGQTITRWKRDKDEISSHQISIMTRSNIFKDFGWSKPDIRSVEIDLRNEYKSFFKERPIIISKLSEEELKLTYGDGLSLSVKKELSKGDLYYTLEAVPI